MTEEIRKFSTKRSTGKIVGIVIACIFFVFLLSGACFVFGLITGSTGGKTPIAAAGGEAIYEIKLEGVISATKYSGLTGVSVTPEEIIEELKTAEESPNVKAILLRINSPGGSAAASQEIYEEIKKVEKPVVVSVADTCASGAYYVACAADKILANRASAVGSIGVIMQIVNLEGLYEKLGIKYTTIKQGKYKDVGSPDRPITPEEKMLLEEQTKEIYEQFISDVAKERGMDVSKVRELATGWVFIGSEALEKGLIDQIGNYSDAVKVAAELGGIKGKPEVVKKKAPTIWDMILSYYLGVIQDKIGKLIGVDYMNASFPVFEY